MPTICFRCSEAEHIELHDRAKGNVSEYLRGLVFDQISSHQALDLVLQRLDLASAPGEEKAGASGLDRQTQSILIELLLLMRGTVKPDTKRAVQAEVERLGLDVWDAGEVGGSGRGR